MFINIAIFYIYHAVMVSNPPPTPPRKQILMRKKQPVMYHTVSLPSEKILLSISWKHLPMQIVVESLKEIFAYSVVNLTV